MSHPIPTMEYETEEIDFDFVPHVDTPAPFLEKAWQEMPESLATAPEIISQYDRETPDNWGGLSHGRSLNF